MLARSGHFAIASLGAATLLTCTLAVDTSSLDSRCPADEKECFGLCFARSSPAVGCNQSACGPCPSEHAIPGCSADGQCIVVACRSGYLNCGGAASPGCTTAKWTNDNCSSCADVCPPPEWHVQGECIPEFGCRIGECLEGFGDCDLMADNGCEVDLQSNQQHCGSCDSACGPGQVCSLGECVSA